MPLRRHEDLWEGGFSHRILFSGFPAVNDL